MDTEVEFRCSYPIKWCWIGNIDIAKANVWLRAGLTHSKHSQLNIYFMFAFGHTPFLGRKKKVNILLLAQQNLMLRTRKKKRNLRLIHCQPNSTQSVCSQITKTLPVRRGKTNYAKYKHAPVYFVCFFFLIKTKNEICEKSVNECSRMLVGILVAERTNTRSAHINILYPEHILMFMYSHSICV